MISQNDLESLRKFDTPTVCNAIEVFNIRPRQLGYMDARIRACFPEMPPMVGFASQVTFRTASPPGGKEPYGSMDQHCAAFNDLPGPPIVVIQDLDVPSASATFGEVMCTMYQTFGAAGLITSGAARDLDQVRELQFPAFSDGAICAHGYCHLVSVHVPVHVGGITLYPGDLLHGDCNGITTIPNEIASELAHICSEYVSAEEIVLGYLNSENPTPQGLAEARDAYNQAIADLTERVAAREEATA